MRVDSRAQDYCERDGARFNLLGEPLNVVSNGFQLCLGSWYIRKLRNEPNVDVNLPGALLYTATAVGSTMWHAVALSWTYFFDILIPVIFIGWFAYNWFYRVLGIRAVWVRLGMAVAAYGGMGALALVHESPYFGVHWSWILLLLPLAMAHRLMCTWQPNALLKAWLLMALALLFYAADRVLCRDEQGGYQPGYHWLWHLCSALGGLKLLRSLPPEDWKVPGHAIDDPWCGGLYADAVSPLRYERRKSSKIAPHQLVAETDQAPAQSTEKTMSDNA